MTDRENPAGVGRLVLHRFCGTEEYVLTKAEMLAYPDGDGVRVWFDAETEGEWVGAEPDTAEARPEPGVSARLDLSSLIPSELVGRRFVPVDRDPVADLPASVSYFDMLELREPVVEVLGREGKVFDVRITGSCTDVNFYDGSKPPTRVEVTGRFTFEEVAEWEGT